MRISLTILLSSLLFQCASADYFTEFIRYEAQPKFSRIIISSETIRGTRGVDHFRLKAKEYELKNMFWTRGHTGESKHIKKVEFMDGHEITTIIQIYPPAGRGQGGAVPNCYLNLYFDGKLRANFPIGYNHRFNLLIPKIVIHAQEKMIEASFNKTEEGVVFNFMNYGDEILILQDAKLKSLKTKEVLPGKVRIFSRKEVKELKFVDEGLYPPVERKFSSLKPGKIMEFRMAGPFRIYCEDLASIDLEVDGKKLLRIKDSGSGNFKFQYQ